MAFGRRQTAGRHSLRRQLRARAERDANQPAEEARGGLQLLFVELVPLARQTVEIFGRKRFEARKPGQHCDHGPLRRRQMRVHQRLGNDQHVVIAVGFRPGLPGNLACPDNERARSAVKVLHRICVARAAALALDHVAVPCSPRDLGGAADHMGPIRLISEKPERALEADLPSRRVTRRRLLQRLKRTPNAPRLNSRQASNRSTSGAHSVEKVRSDDIAHPFALMRAVGSRRHLFVAAIARIVRGIRNSLL